MTILRGFAMKTKSMDDLIKGFFSNSLNNDEYRQLYENMKEKKHPTIYKKTAIEIKEDPVTHITLTESSGSITFDSGLTLTLCKNGDMNVTYDGKAVQMEEDLTLKISVHHLSQIYNHIIRLHKLDNAIAQSEIMAEKTRYIHTNNKKAFIAGMLTGQRLTKS